MIEQFSLKIVFPKRAFLEPENEGPKIEYNRKRA